MVVPPSDIGRLRRLVRLVLNQVGQRLTERMEFPIGGPAKKPTFTESFRKAIAEGGCRWPSGTSGADGKGYKHRLLLLIDEFTSLGKLDFFETQLAFCAGYGLKCFMVAQSLNQLQKTYGDKNSILDNSHIRVTYAANDEITAKRISDLVGQATLTKRQKSFSAAKLLGGRSVSESEQEFARPLLTADEVLRLPVRRGDRARVRHGAVPGEEGHVLPRPTLRRPRRPAAARLFARAARAASPSPRARLGVGGGRAERVRRRRLRLRRQAAARPGTGDGDPERPRGPSGAVASGPHERRLGGLLPSGRGGPGRGRRGGRATGATP